MRAVQNFEERCPGQVEVGKAEIFQVRRNQGFYHGGATAILQKQLIAGQDVSGLERTAACRGALNLGDEAAYRGESRSPAPGAHRANPQDVDVGNIVPQE